MAVVEQKWSALAGALRDGVPRPGPQAALPRPGLLRDGSRAAVAAGLADGLPARGDPAAARLRRVRVPRPVGHRRCAPTTWASSRSRTPAAIVASRSSRAVGPAPRGFRCPFHGWCYGLDGKNTAVTQRRTFAEHNLVEEDLDLTPVRCEMWGGCAWINFDHDAPPVRECLEPAATSLDAWKVESMRAEKWYACRLPVNWKLAIEAFVEMYHVVQTHPQLVIPTRFGLREGDAVRPAGLHRRRHPVPARDERRHGRHVSRRRRAHRREPARRRAPGRPVAGDGHLEPHAQRRGRALAPGSGPRHPRPQRARRAGDQPDVLPRLPALLRAARCTAAPPPTGSARWGRRRR